MFKDLPEGQTHSFNDGCGEKEHNKCNAVINALGPMICKADVPCRFHPKEKREWEEGLRDVLNNWLGNRKDDIAGNPAKIVFSCRCRT